MRRSSTTTSCTGPSSIRTGISCAPNATRPACARITTRRPIASPRAWSEISVGCEACHGQGSRHVAWAQRRSKAGGHSARREDPQQRAARSVRRAPRCRLADRSGNRATRSEASRPPLLRKEVETCGLVPRARAASFSEDWVPGRWLSRHACRRAARAQGSISADGQMLRRGLQLRLVQAEQDVRGRRHLQRLPRAAQRKTSCAG